ncbi:unnamed protein product [Arctogadus glacialis]
MCGVTAVNTEPINYRRMDAAFICLCPTPLSRGSRVDREARRLTGDDVMRVTRQKDFQRSTISSEGVRGQPEPGELSSRVWAAGSWERTRQPAHG